MASNGSLANQNSTLSPPSVISTIIPQIGYITLGLIGLLLSGFISISLLFKSVELRQGQRHILLTTMEIANFGLNFSYFLAGSFRLKYVMTGEYLLRVSAWECMTRIYNVLFTFNFPFVMIALLANVCERFIAVTYPIFYYHNVKTKHQLTVSLLLVAYCGFAMAAAFISSYNLDRAPSWPYACLTANAVGKAYTTYYYTHTFIFIIISAPISLATVLTLIRKHKVGTTISNVLPSAYLVKQKSLNNAMVLAAVVVFCIMCPLVIANFITLALRVAPFRWAELLTPYFALLVMTHSIVNDIILCSMNQQVRNSIKELYRSIFLRLKKTHVTHSQTSNINRLHVGTAVSQA